MENSFKEISIKEYTRELSSSEAVPGGGGTSALVGALAVSLGNMVGSLTVGKKKYQDVEDEIKDLMARGESLRLKLLDLIDKDAESFIPLAAAYRIDKEDPNRDEIMEKALKGASMVPLDIIKACKEVVEIIEILAEKGSRLAVSDAGAAATLVKAAAEAAVLNIYINTKFMKNRNYAENQNKIANNLVKECVERAEGVYGKVVENLM